MMEKLLDMGVNGSNIEGMVSQQSGGGEGVIITVVNAQGSGGRSNVMGMDTKSEK